MQSGFLQFKLTAAVSSVWRDVNWAVIKGLTSALDFCNVCFLQTGNCQAPSSALERLLLKKADDDLKIGLQCSDFLEFWVNKGLGDGEWMPASVQGVQDDHVVMVRRAFQERARGEETSERKGESLERREQCFADNTDVGITCMTPFYERFLAVLFICLFLCRFILLETVYTVCVLV